MSNIFIINLFQHMHCFQWKNLIFLHGLICPCILIGPNQQSLMALVTAFWLVQTSSLWWLWSMHSDWSKPAVFDGSDHSILIGPNQQSLMALIILALSCSCIEPSLAFTTEPTSIHQRLTWPGLYRKLIGFLHIVVCHMRVSARLLEVMYLECGLWSLNTIEL